MYDSKVSDDGSSILSSPRGVRDASVWKQSVPLKGVSSSLEFFFHVSPCVLKLRQNVRVSKKRGRRPYSPFNIGVEDTDEQLCTCFDKSSSISSSALKCNTEKPYSRINDEDCTTIRKVDSIAAQLGQKVKSLVGNLSKSTSDNAEKNINANCASCDQSPPQKFSLTPKKRAFKEGLVDLRPKSLKKSPPSEKTILNVPELGTRSKLSMNYGIEQKATGSRDKVKKSPTKKPRQRSPSNGVGSGITSASTGKPVSLLKPSVAELMSSGGSSTTGLNSFSRNNRDSPAALKEASDLFMTEEQQRAMSNAISYTINSLLGNGNPNDPAIPEKEVLTKKSKDRTDKKKGNKKHPEVSALFGVAGQDQNSFLRHLLDTSDPIPASTSPNNVTNSTITKTCTKAEQTSTNEPSRGGDTKMQSSMSNCDHSSKSKVSTSLNKKSPSTSIQASGLGYDTYVPRNTFPNPSAPRNGEKPELATAFHHYNALGFFPNLNAAAAAAMASYLSPASHGPRAPGLSQGLGIPPGLLASGTGAWPPGFMGGFPFTAPYAFHGLNGTSVGESSNGVGIDSSLKSSNSSGSSHVSTKCESGRSNHRVREQEVSCAPYDLSIRGSSRQSSQKERIPMLNNFDEGKLIKQVIHIVLFTCMDNRTQDEETDI